MASVSATVWLNMGDLDVLMAGLIVFEHIVLFEMHITTNATLDLTLIIITCGDNPHRSGDIILKTCFIFRPSHYCRCKKPEPLLRFQASNIYLQL
jgi:hypothetical protein